MLKRLIQDKKGSALVLSICLLAIIAILAVGMAGVTSMVYKKTTYDVNRQQAYFNAKSGIETALNSIVSQKDDALIQAIRNAGGTLVSDPIEFADGTYTLTLRLLNSDPDNPQLSVTATGEDHGKKYSISSKVEGSITRTKPPFAVTHAVDMTGDARLVNAIIEGGVIARPGSSSLTLNNCTVSKGDIMSFARFIDESHGDNWFNANVFIGGDSENNQLGRGTNINGNLYLAPGIPYKEHENPLKSITGKINLNQDVQNPHIDPPPTSFENIRYWLDEGLVDTKNGTYRLDVTKGDIVIKAGKGDENNDGALDLIGKIEFKEDPEDKEKIIKYVNIDGNMVMSLDNLDIVYDPEGDNGNVTILLPDDLDYAEPEFSGNIGRLINKSGQPIDNEGNLVYYDSDGRPRKAADNSLADVTPRLFIVYYAKGGNLRYKDNCIFNGYLLTDIINKRYIGYEYGINVTINGGIRGSTMTAQANPIKIFYVDPKDGFTQGGSSSTSASWSVGGFQKGDGK